MLPPYAVDRRAGARGVSRDLPMVKVKTSEGLVARLLMVGIVRIAPRNKLIDQGLFYKIASAWR